MRCSEGFVEDLDLVMEKNGEIIGQIVFYETELYKDDGSHLPHSYDGTSCNKE